MILFSGFFRCLCGKLHCYGGISPTSECVCGINLNQYAFYPSYRNDMRTLLRKWYSESCEP